MTRPQIEALQSRSAQRTPAQQKIDTALLDYLRQQRQGTAAQAAPGLRPHVAVEAGNKVRVNIRATITPALLAEITQRGGTVRASIPASNVLSAVVPLDALEPIAARPDVMAIQVTPKATNNGPQDPEGDVAHTADVARTVFGSKGHGIKICVISNDVKYLTDAQSPSKGSLGTVTILPGQDGLNFPVPPYKPATGEGTAMLEIVHRIAPDAELLFASGNESDVKMAANIDDFGNRGCKIIVDDVSYPNESPFQDGTISQAVNRVAAKGILFLSSAGNNGNAKNRTSRTWEGDFKAGPAASNGTEHAFDPNPQTGWYDAVLPDAVNDNNGLNACPQDGEAHLFWSDPLGSPRNQQADVSDYALYAVNPAGQAISFPDEAAHTPQQDPYRTVYIPPPNHLPPGSANATRPLALVVVKLTGKADRFLHLDTSCGRLQHATAGSARGHNAAENALSIAATSAHAMTKPFQGGPAVGVEYYSSDGPRRMFFKPDGTAYNAGNRMAGGAAVFNKPDFTAADQVTTDVPNFGSFWGTSAAAPNAAGIAALIWSHKPNLSAAQVVSAMRDSALKIESHVGWNNLSGNGIVMAEDAVRAADPQARDAVAAIANFRNQAIAQQRLTVTPGAGAQYNAQYGGWRLLAPGASNFNINIPVNQTPHDLKLTIKHLSSAEWPRAGYSPISIAVNGTTIEKSYDVAAAHGGSRDYEWDQFFIPASSLHQGANTVTLTLQQGARTHYWIDYLRLDP